MEQDKTKEMQQITCPDAVEQHQSPEPAALQPVDAVEQEIAAEDTQIESPLENGAHETGGNRETEESQPASANNYNGYGYAPPGGNYPAYGPPAYRQPGVAVLPYTEREPKQPFTATKSDARFAVFAILLGFLFLRWFVMLTGWGVLAFTGIFAVGVLLYARSKSIAAPAQSWFWFAVMLLTATGCALWPYGSHTPLACLLIFASAVLWCAALFGIFLEGKLGNFLPLDAINLLVLAPFRNFACWFKALTQLGSRQQEQPEQQEQQSQRARYPVLGALGGVLIFLLLLAAVLPLLIEADEGIFSSLLQVVSLWIEGLNLSFNEIFFQLLFGFPVALYICGLVMGAAHKRYSKNIELGAVRQATQALRLLPRISAITALALTSILYILFIVCQIPYFFSAFSGLRPAGYEIYSEYARSGFFELCRVAAINLGLMALVGSFCKIKMVDSGVIRFFNIILSALTMLMVLTAFSKMALYISAYGLSQLRIQTIIFMLFLFLLCIGVIILQFKRFSIVRYAAITAAGLLCALCLCNPAGLVVRYNAGQYLAGNLQQFDTYILYESGYDGVIWGIRVYEATQDEELKSTIERKLNAVQRNSLNKYNICTITLSDLLTHCAKLPDETINT